MTKTLVDKWKILVVGESEMDARKCCVGQSPTTLSSTGREQIQRIKHSLGPLKFDRVFCSDQQHARETWEIVKDCIDNKAVFVEELRERSCGRWDGVPYTEIKNELGPRGYRNWDRDMTVVPVMGESIVDVHERFSQWFEGVSDEQRPQETVLFITHPDTARAIIMEARKEMGDKVMSLNIVPGMIYSVLVERKV